VIALLKDTVAVLKALWEDLPNILDRYADRITRNQR